MAARLFTKVNLVAIVGGDFPQEHIDFLKSRSQTHGIFAKPEILNFIPIAENLQTHETIGHARGVAMSFGFAVLLRAAREL